MLHDFTFIDPRTEGLRQAVEEELRNDNFEFLETLGATTVIRKK
jgi:hypothetical protein